MKIPEVSALALLGVALVGGAWFLSWHAFANDDEDTDWLDPGQPPAQVSLPLVPGAHAASPVVCNTGGRGRCYPDVLAAAADALKGA